MNGNTAKGLILLGIIAAFAAWLLYRGEQEIRAERRREALDQEAADIDQWEDELDAEEWRP